MASDLPSWGLGRAAAIGVRFGWPELALPLQHGGCDRRSQEVQAVGLASVFGRTRSEPVGHPRDGKKDAFHFNGEFNP